MFDENFSPLIQPEALLDLYESKQDFILIDTSYGPQAQESYIHKHLDGALFANLDSHLSDIKDDPAAGGRHPLPSIEKFSRTLSGFGIRENSRIILYDHRHGALAAARFWWMLRSAGHKKVQVLNGGFAEAERVGFPVNNRIVQTKKAPPYPVKEWKLLLTDLEEVEKAAGHPDYLVIDVRASERYRGQVEPIDAIAGHIPGAINIPLTENLDQNQRFLSPEKLKKKYKTVFTDKEEENIIVHCGSGVSACHTLLALDYAGMRIPKLYVGSWSEWSRSGKPIATEE